MKISNLPQKGMADWFPNEFEVRNYIFNVWRKVCTRYGYKEYLTPLLESAEIYKAKSGEEVGGNELMVLVDRAGRELSIRPEMTPSVTRMVTRIFPSELKPIRYFSIANFIRNQKPQRGRNREFWQLNYDIFGSDSKLADVEVIQIALDIMLEFNPPENSFELSVNSRKLVDEFLTKYIKISKEKQVEVIRILDKFLKLSEEDFKEKLKEINLSDDNINQIILFLKCSDIEEVEKEFPETKDSILVIKELLNTLKDLRYSKYVKFSPIILRGLDYYDGIIFEMFDKNPENPRSLFGGGRYNGLASIFGGTSFPAVGCAPGDETTYLFLESWGLIDRIKSEIKTVKYFAPILDQSTFKDLNKVMQELRKNGKNIELGVELQGMSKALQYASKGGFDYVIIYGTNEIENGKIIIKDLKSGNQKEYNIDSIKTDLI